MSQARNSQSSKLKPQDSPCLDFALEPLAGLGGGPGGQGRGESPPFSGDLDRSTKDISARGGIVDTGVFMVSYVCIWNICVCNFAMVKQGRWMLRDEDSESCNLYTSRFLDIIG